MSTSSAIEGYSCVPRGAAFVINISYPSYRFGSHRAFAKDTAWQHKERLLRFDREFARRTVVLDDQADYFRNQTSTWLTQEEQEEAFELESERQQKMHARQKQKLNLDF